MLSNDYRWRSGVGLWTAFHLAMIDVSEESCCLPMMAQLGPQLEMNKCNVFIVFFFRSTSPGQVLGLNELSD